MRDLALFQRLGGAVIDDKFRVERILGQGACGVVLLAVHTKLGERRALKFLNPALTDDTSIRRFVREGRAAARLAGEHAVHVFDVGEHPQLGPYLVMEYVDGHALDTLLATGPLPIAVAVDYVLQACTALAEAHQAGVIHRDLKPANLFVTRRPDGRAILKVMDFGLAKWAFSASITATNVMLGSPGYMAPEQARNARHVDARADFWSLGAVLYELVTGRRPYPGTGIAELVSQLLTEAPTPLPATLPRGLRAVIERCLARAPSERYATVGELAAALVPFGGPDATRLGAQVQAIEAAPRARRHALGVAATIDAVGPRRGRADDRSARRARTAVAALSLITVLLATAVVTKRLRGSPAHHLDARDASSAVPAAGVAPVSTEPVDSPTSPPLAPPLTTVQAPPAPTSTTPAVAAPAPLPPPLPNTRRLRDRPTPRRGTVLAPASPPAPPPSPPRVPGDLDGDGIPDIR